MKSKPATSDRFTVQKVFKPLPIRDPLLLAILVTAAVLTGLIFLMYLSWGSGRVLADTPWYIPVTHSFAGLAAFSVAFLAFGRYPVLRDAASYWIGMGFVAIGIQSVFFILAWPGLLPGGQAIIARLPSTSGWIAMFELASLSISLLLAVLSRWPGWSQDNWPVYKPLPSRRWLWSAVAWIGLVILICILIVVFEQHLPVLVGPQGNLTALILSLDWGYLLLFSVGAFLSARRYQQTRDSLLGYVALTQLALAFVVLTAIIGAKRYDIWYYLSRVIIVGGFLTLMFGLLSEYVRLFRRENEGRLLLDAILENIPIGLAVTGGPPDYPLDRVSRHGLKMNQRTVGELIGLPSGQHQAAWRIFLSDGVTQPQPEQMPLYRASRFGEETRNLEMVMKAQDGRKISVLVNAAPIRDAAGQIITAINTWLDISDIKQAEVLLEARNEALQKYATELERANRDLRNFTIMASHDLQEPLRKIEVFGEALLAESKNFDESQYNRILRIRKSAQQMRNMLNGLYQFTFLTTDTQPFQPVDLHQIALEIAGALERKIQQAGGVVEVGELPEIEADPKQMRMLLLNLLENAVKFQPSGGKPYVKIHFTQPDPARVQIIIEDNGIGFDEAYAGHLFEPFERLSKKTQTEYEGSGMGLAICRRIVERHSGEIRAKSKLGKGTIMIVTLPVRQQVNPSYPSKEGVNIGKQSADPGS